MHKALHDGCKIHYTEEGVGRNVILIPGLGGNCVQMADIREALVSNYRVITIDPRGGGESDRPDVAYTAADLVADTIAVMNDCDCASADIIGISFGAMIAQEVALAHPKRTRSLVLASSYAAADAWSLQMWRVRETMIEKLGMREHMELAIMFLFSPQTFRSEIETIDALPEDLTGEDVKFVTGLDFGFQNDPTAIVKIYMRGMNLKKAPALF